MSEPMRTVHVAVHLGESDQAVLRRHMDELNTIFAESNALMKTLGMSSARPLVESEVIQMLVRAALDRERNLQMLQDNRDDPPWIARAVRDAMQDLGRGEKT